MRADSLHKVVDLQLQLADDASALRGRIEFAKSLVNASGTGIDAQRATELYNSLSNAAQALHALTEDLLFAPRRKR